MSLPPTYHADNEQDEYELYGPGFGHELTMNVGRKRKLDSDPSDADDEHSPDEQDRRKKMRFTYAELARGRLTVAEPDYEAQEEDFVQSQRSQPFRAPLGPLYEMKLPDSKQYRHVGVEDLGRSGSHPQPQRRAIHSNVSSKSPSAGRSPRPPSASFTSVGFGPLFPSREASSKEVSQKALCSEYPYQRASASNRGLSSNLSSQGESSSNVGAPLDLRSRLAALFSTRGLSSNFDAQPSLPLNGRVPSNIHEQAGLLLDERPPSSFQAPNITQWGSSRIIDAAQYDKDFVDNYLLNLPGKRNVRRLDAGNWVPGGKEKQMAEHRMRSRKKAEDKERARLELLRRSQQRQVRYEDNDEEEDDDGDDYA
ncbi:MAG: hypothetical protein M1818_003711 [Claussenomyces sp. TS43310]|nr:MAG: hypothetical protein M1818_003711 [Claussenomyces sp. TS43310]